jgi:hypothetical protein
MKTATTVICAILIGALMGAWITYLPERNEQERLDAVIGAMNAELVASTKELDNRNGHIWEQNGQIVELGKRLNLCLVEAAVLKDTVASLSQSNPPPPGYTIDKK